MTTDRGRPTSSSDQRDETEGATVTTEDQINTINDHLVGVNGAGVVVTLPPRGPMDRDEALRLAAWLVAVADPHGERFEEIRNAVLNT
jgi:hypothetical protein